MKKTSLTRALFVAGAIAATAGFAQADSVFHHPAVRSSEVTTVDTTTLGAGSSQLSSTTITTTTPVYVLPNIHYDRSIHPALSGRRSLDMDRSAAATFDVPTRAGEASTMTGGAPNLLTSNEQHASLSYPAPVVTGPDTRSLGAGPSTLRSSSQCGLAMSSCNYLPD